MLTKWDRRKGDFYDYNSTILCRIKKNIPRKNNNSNFTNKNEDMTRLESILTIDIETKA